MNCPEWAAYEKEREQAYKQRAMELEADRAIIGNATNRANARMKKWMADRPRKSRR